LFSEIMWKLKPRYSSSSASRAFSQLLSFERLSGLRSAGITQLLFPRYVAARQFGPVRLFDSPQVACLLGAVFAHLVTKTFSSEKFFPV
jgi:hypothetical protein